MTDTKPVEYVVVTATSTHRMRYCIPLKELQNLNPDAKMDPHEWAKDCVTMEECEEFSQDWLGEQIVDTSLYTEDEILDLFDADNSYLMSWPKAMKLDHINDWRSKVNETAADMVARSEERQKRYHEYMLEETRKANAEVKE